MSYKVFFAFQMDTEDTFGKGFIQSAIELAIAQFKVEGINITLDFGFRGTPGTPLLIDEMLKKSNDSDMVIVDLTYTSAKEWLNAEIIDEDNDSKWICIPKTDRKPSPNPNVLLETGYAWAKKGTYRTLAVMNEAFGTPDDLPVDLKGFRWGITFNLNETNYACRKEIRKELAKDIFDAIKAAINSEAEYQREKWNPIRIHKDWSHKNFNTQYFTTERIKTYIQQLRIALKNPENPQRIIGPKNSGKTRLAFELYNTIDEHLPLDSDIEKVLYYDLSIGSISGIEKKLLDLKLLNQRKILIFDNCPIKIHQLIYNNYLFDTPICLLSIDNQSSDQQGTINLDSDFADEIIQNISEQTANPQTASYIVYNSKSNINEAIAFIEAFSSGDLKLSDEYQIKWDQILGESLLRNKGLLLLEEMSLFTHIGYTGEYQYQSSFIVEILNLESRSDFTRLIELLIEKNLVTIAGDYIILKTFVEELAIKRLDRLIDESISEYIEKLALNKLSKQFADRLIELSSLESTTSIIEILTKEDGLLSKYDFISTDEGSRILMSLSEIAPKQTLAAINSALITKSISELKELKKGRRYLVWALERLCFRKETFPRAATIMYRLALAENEIISNNASSQFSQLFQVYLPGTEASLTERKILLNELLSTPEEGKFPVILNAINRGLGVQDWMRMGGADKQAGIDLQDYHPVKPEEISIFWDQLIEMLLEIGTKEAFQIIINRFSQQFQRGNRTAILEAIKHVLGETQEIDKTLRQQFANILSEQNKYDPVHIQILLGLEKQYSNNTIEELLKVRVVEPPYSSYKSESGKIIDHAEIIAREYAHELLTDESNQWIERIVILLQGDQRQSFNFGNEIGLFKPEFNELIDASIEKLTTIPSEKQNNSLIEGYLYSSNDQTAIRKVIDQYLAHLEINFHAIRLTKLLEINIEDLEKLKPIIVDNPNYSFSLQYLNINHLSLDEFIGFIDWLKDVEPYGRWSAIEFTYDYLNKNEDKLPNLKEFLPTLLMKEGILSSESKSQIPHHYYKKLVEKLNEVGGLGLEVIEFLANEILLYTSDFNYRDGYSLFEIIDILFTNYWDKSWPIISQRMVGKDFYGSYNLINLLKIYKAYKIENLIAWMDIYPLTAPQCVIHFVDFESQEDGKVVWSPLILEMLNKYGTNEIFLNDLSAVLNSWSAIGSALPLLEGRKQLIEQLLNHPIQQVKEFAEAELKNFDTRIKQEIIFNQNINIEYS
jgi:hypothetical protein